MKPDNPTQAADPRRRAEQRLQDWTPSPEAPLSPTDMQQLIHELQAEVVKLELQNEQLHASLAETGASATGYVDLAERKRVEQALRESEARYRNLAENAQDIVYRYRLSPPRGFEYVSPAATVISGYTPDEHYADPDLGLKLIHPDDRHVVEAALQGRIRRRETQVHRWRRKDGAVIWVEQRRVPFFDEQGDLAAIEGVVRDITERKQAEQALRESEERFRNLAENASDIIYRYRLSPPRRFEYVSPAVTAITGYTPDEHYADPDLGRKLMHPDDRHVWEAALRGEIRQRETHIHRWQRKDGAIVWVEWRRTPIFDEYGTVVAIEGVIRDISERKRVEQALRESEERFRALSEDSLVGVYTVQDGVLSYVNPALARIFGYAPEELIGANPLVVIHPDDHALVSENIRRRMAGEVKGIQYEFRGLCKHGETKCIEVLGVRIDLYDRPAIIGNIVDITGRKLAENELRRKNRALQAISGSNQALLRARDERALLDEICRICVEVAGYRMAWAGYAEHDERQSVRPAAQAGFEAGYLDTVDITWADSERGRGPTGTAIRTDQPVIARNILADPAYAPWRAAAMQRGYASAIALPLPADGRVLGALSIYAVEPDAFDADEVELLQELADDLAYGIEALRTRAERKRSDEELKLAYDLTIEGWSRALDMRDKETEGHTQRVAEMTLRLARAAGMNEDELVHIRRGALLHDIGKMGVPDAILLKPEPLSAEEWVSMRRHPELAIQMLAPIAHLRPALDIPGSHHEKWDGTGYPLGLQGERIPLAARLFAVVDVWDALRSDRPYRAGWPEDKVLEHIRALSGTHFDPRAVELFCRVIGQWDAGATRI